MKLQITIELTEEQQEKLERYAHAYGFFPKRENPRKPWTAKEKKTCLRIACSEMLLAQVR